MQNSARLCLLMKSTFPSDRDVRMLKMRTCYPGQIIMYNTQSVRSKQIYLLLYGQINVKEAYTEANARSFHLE